MTNTIYFLSRPVNIVSEQLSKRGTHFDHQNDFDKRVCVSPKFKIVVEKNMLYSENKDGVFELHDQDLATFYVFAQSYEDAKQLVEECLQDNMPESNKEWNYTYRILSVETVGAVW
jgi:hypothetical protein